MKLIYCVLILFLIKGMVGCNIDDIDVYQSDNYISFTNKEQDTVIVSFFMLGNLSEYSWPIEVRYTGIPKETEQSFVVSVVEDKTTLKEGFFDLPDKLNFQPMNKLDTFYVHLTNYPELKEEKALLCLELEENAIFKLGDRNYRRIYLLVNDNVARPDWWTTRVENYFLGTYSDKKFRLLVEVVQPDLSDTSEAWIRSWALEFKDWLDANPTEDENGDPMTVPVRI